MPVVQILNLADFQTKLREAGSSKVVVCDFYADWCGPCRMIAPYYAQLSDRFSNAVFCKVNVDNCRDVSMQYGVRAMPTFLLFKNGVEVQRIQGANQQALEAAINQYYSDVPANPLAATHAERAFLDQFVRQTEKSRFYGDVVHKTLALSVLPGEKLTRDATVEGKVNRFLLAKNLLEWFKGEFFSWVDTPACDKCGSQTAPETRVSGTPSPEELEYGASRVEVYICKCGEQVRFPRYNDPAKLLETRRGRCGEWANCFTLCAAALDFDVRFIYDVTDHVWTELWIPELDRWVHADACENLIDAPLVYEKGWKKQLSYVLAIGVDHVCDVTWRFHVCADSRLFVMSGPKNKTLVLRYVLDSKKTMKIRTAVREPVLSNVLGKLSARLSKDAPKSRIDELERRRLQELIDFLHIGERKDVKDYGGRLSGDEKWKTERGESGTCDTGSPKRKQIVLRPNDQELANKKFRLTYDSVKNVYKRGEAEIKGFQALVFKSKDVQHKKELDWKMVYLCRKEGKTEAELCWTVDLTGLKAKRASLKVRGAQTYEDGRVILTVCADDMCARVPSSGELVMEDPPSAMLQIKAHFSGGRGDSAFQHSQLFRSSLERNSEDPHFEIDIDLL